MLTALGAVPKDDGEAPGLWVRCCRTVSSSKTFAVPLPGVEQTQRNAMRGRTPMGSARTNDMANSKASSTTLSTGRRHRGCLSASICHCEPPFPTVAASTFHHALRAAGCNQWLNCSPIPQVVFGDGATGQAIHKRTQDLGLVVPFRLLQPVKGPRAASNLPSGMYPVAINIQHVVVSCRTAPEVFDFLRWLGARDLEGLSPTWKLETVPAESSPGRREFMGLYPNQHIQIFVVCSVFGRFEVDHHLERTAPSLQTLGVEVKSIWLTDHLRSTATMSSKRSVGQRQWQPHR